MKKAVTIFLTAALCLGLLAACTDGGNVSQNPSGMIESSEMGRATQPSETSRATTPSATQGTEGTERPSETQDETEHTGGASEATGEMPSDNARGAARNGRTGGGMLG